MLSDTNPYQAPKYCPNEEPPAPTADYDDAVYFVGALTVDDSFEAVHVAKNRSQILSARFSTACLAIILVVATGYAGYAFYYDEDAVIQLVVMAMIDVVVVAVAIAHPVSLRSRANELFRQGKGLHTPTRGQVDDTGIQSQTDTAEARLKWSAFCGYRNSERVALLYQQFPSQYVIFARTKFASDQDWRRFLEIVSKKLSPR